MEVLVGPTFGIAAAAQEGHGRLFLSPEEGVIAKAPPPEDSSETSSSIGAPDDSSDEASVSDDENEAQSKFRGGSLASLDSLDDSLPIKRGLSNHFSGKSKSFASLADVCTVRDLKKTENPLNKKRRLLIASKWSKKSFYSWSNPKSMPLLALKEDDDDDDDDDNDEDDKESNDQDHQDHDDQATRLPKFHDKRMKSFKTRCFSLADLQEHSRFEDHDDDNN